MTSGGRHSEPARGTYASFERLVVRIANARSVTFGLAGAFFVLALAFWWALQTVTTVGYGDVVPTTSTGKVVGGIEMMIGISLISLLTAAVTSVVIQRGETASREEDRAHLEQTAETILAAIAEIDDRLDKLESQSREV